MQYTPYDIHQKNSEELAIQTWKCIFVAGLSSIPEKTPVENWCKLTNKNYHLFNMMCPCLQNTSLLEFEALEGIYSFDAMPMEPPGTECLVHLETIHCTTWGFHALDAWYIGSALKNYCCFKVIKKQTNTVRLNDTIKLKHQYIPIPKLTSVVCIVKSTKLLSEYIDGYLYEAPPYEMKEIENLRSMLIGEQTRHYED